MLETIAMSDSMILIFILAAFIVIGYKALSILKNAAIIALLAYIFPLVLNNIFGMSFATGFDAQLHYITLALGMYLVYEVLEMFLGIGKLVLGLFEILAMPIVWVYDAIKSLTKGTSKVKKEKETSKAKKGKAESSEPVNS